MGVNEEERVTSWLLPELLWDGRTTRAGAAVAVRDGRIATVTEAGDVPRDAEAEGAVRRLPGWALMAAPVNAHSHAFQRAIRGATQTRPAGRPDADFWSWREAMYAAVLDADPEWIHAASLACFREMRAAGWGSVGEFHYLHRDPEGRRYDDPLTLANVVVEAARTAGLSITLLHVAYATADVDGSPLDVRQRRFRCDSVDEVIADVEALAARWRHDARVTVGLAPHSVRGVPVEWWRPLAEAAEAMDLPLHAHVSEQRREVEACRAVHGCRPVELLDREGVLSPRFTAVHATHLTDTEVELLSASGARVCGCPSTERDLGDGVLPADRLAAASVPLCLGSDSHTLLDPWEELRLPEYHLRLVRERRVVLGEPEGELVRWAPGALRTATEEGGAALRTGAGRLAPGAPAELVAIDLGDSALAGVTAETFPEMLAVAGRAGLARPVDLQSPPASSA
ncbi:formimidoylglutamate deiminase [Gaopeijia maritima]|uniref:formimidoylglutamate deiminase n=1 Tax=Gaopeijia maritima TaxID=3119007 RepID=UPI003277B759